ncbi:MAG TPA: M23 family peptidase [Cyanothece sp. UBA12306]|nr:M23 family peptidase [Cyanothece sp. UBA12306]
MKPLSYRLTLTSVSLFISVLCNNMVVASGDSVDQRQFTPHSPNKTILKTPGRFIDYIWPTQGRMTSGYGMRFGNMHEGIDIAGPIGTPIFAAASGVVIFAGWDRQGYGQLIKIRHGDGSISFYGHNSEILVRRGQQVTQGQQISKMGSTGYSTGPHLHFEIHPQGRKAVNPIAFLPKEPVGVTNVRRQNTRIKPSRLGSQNTRLQRQQNRQWKRNNNRILGE